MIFMEQFKPSAFRIGSLVDYSSHKTCFKRCFFKALNEKVKGSIKIDLNCEPESLNCRDVEWRIIQLLISCNCVLFSHAPEMRVLLLDQLTFYKPPV